MTQQEHQIESLYALARLASLLRQEYTDGKQRMEPAQFALVVQIVAERLWNDAVEADAIQRAK